MTYPIITPKQKSLMEIGLANDSIPKILYKYRTEEQTLMFVDNLKGYFALAKEFNDPFECKMSVKTNVSLEKLIDYLEAQGYAGNSSQKAREMLANPDMLHDITQKAIYDVIDGLGIFCCSAVCNSILMWTHYAKEHTGFCLEFDVSKDIDFFCFPHKVKYDAVYPSFDYYANNGEVTKALFHKYEDWKYEKEYRIIKMWFSGLHKLKPMALKNIIAGCKTSEDALYKVIEKVRQNNTLNHVGFKRAVMNKSEYKLNVIDIK